MRHPELNRFWVALGFLTRIPVPCDLDFSQSQLNRSARYFPLVGLIVGAGVAGCTWLFEPVFGSTIAVLAGMAVSLRLTGAFHEDGLADSLDGLGGGWTQEQVLGIMKDSRLGTYGSCGLLLALALKASCLIHLFEHEGKSGITALLVAHSFSRLAPLVLMRALPYVGGQGSKSKPLARSPSGVDLAIASGLGLFPLGWLLSGKGLCLLVAMGGCVLTWWYRVLKRRLGGYTGDTLGAAQQWVELGVYGALVGAWTSF